jgi:drug/metabolite transporter (DMT)-like permease
MELVEQAMWLLLVSLLWGATNPFLKRGSIGIEDIEHKNRILKFMLEMKFLFFNWRYMLPFVMNQLGAVLYYTTIGKADITLAVPITNSLTFIFTTLFGHLLGEKISKWTITGVAMVTTGVVLCVTSKIS